MSENFKAEKSQFSNFWFWQLTTCQTIVHYFKKIKQWDLMRKRLGTTALFYCQHIFKTLHFRCSVPTISRALSRCTNRKNQSSSSSLSTSKISGTISLSYSLDKVCKSNFFFRWDFVRIFCPDFLSGFFVRIFCLDFIRIQIQ